MAEILQAPQLRIENTSPAELKRAFEVPPIEVGGPTKTKTPETPEQSRDQTGAPIINTKVFNGGRYNKSESVGTVSSSSPGDADLWIEAWAGKTEGKAPPK